MTGDDHFTWDPGDGSDTVEGQGGDDTLVFNGSNIAEHIALAANGGRLQLTRDVAAIVMDANGTEHVALAHARRNRHGRRRRSLGTDVKSVDLDLGSDAQVDTINVTGTDGRRRDRRHAVRLARDRCRARRDDHRHGQRADATSASADARRQRQRHGRARRRGRDRGELAQLKLGSPARRFAARRGSELREHGGDVMLRRSRRDDEPLGDLRVRQPFAEQREHLELPRRQPGRVRARRLALPRGDAEAELAHARRDPSLERLGPELRASSSASTSASSSSSSDSASARS